MYGNQNTGMQWNFLATLLVVGLAFTVGLFVSNAELLRPATTQYELDILRAEKERAEIARAEEAKRQAALTIQAQENAQKASERVDNLIQITFDTINTGIIILSVAASVSLTVWTISKAVIAYKMATMNQMRRHTPSPEALFARQIERANRLKELELKEQKTKRHTSVAIPYTRPFWPEDEQELSKNRDQYPLAN